MCAVPYCTVCFCMYCVCTVPVTRCFILQCTAFGFGPLQLPPPQMSMPLTANLHCRSVHTRTSSRPSSHIPPPHMPSGIILRIYDEHNIVVMFFDEDYEHGVVPVAQCRFFTPDARTVGLDVVMLTSQAKKGCSLAGTFPAALQRATNEYKKQLYSIKRGRPENLAATSADYVYHGPLVHGKDQLRKWCGSATRMRGFAPVSHGGGGGAKGKFHAVEGGCLQKGRVGPESGLRACGGSCLHRLGRTGMPSLIPFGTGGRSHPKKTVLTPSRPTRRAHAHLSLVHKSANETLG